VKFPRKKKKQLVIPVIEYRKIVHDPLKLETPDEVEFTVAKDHIVIKSEEDTEEEKKCLYY